ncbi:MAG: hypothetical protein GY873_11455 [Bosea sp.]|uniref:hypothetical protein n=1 Tax=Bosea sp. (in: a-proteobacteria) TaxID=1871050 RepID=UPI00238E52BD|nr:hypothetical protein [Bosea sp. (in: a-proteobacteria)]MCP4734800.1 hypothetical protein [Bosea sp. (in: a-proteobacteria)]
MSIVPALVMVRQRLDDRAVAGGNTARTSCGDPLKEWDEPAVIDELRTLMRTFRS